MLMIDDGSGYTITWPAVNWVGGVAPTLATSGYSITCAVESRNTTVWSLCWRSCLMLISQTNAGYDFPTANRVVLFRCWRQQ